MTAWSKLMIFGGPLPVHLQLIWRHETPVAGHHGHISFPGESRKPAGQSLHHAIFPATQFGDIDFRGANDRP